MELCLILIPILFVTALLVWFLAHGLDGFRIREHLESRGGRKIKARRLTKGKGWFDITNERDYKVTYYDQDDNEHETAVKTSLWSGVQWGEDNVVRFADQIKKETTSEKDLKKLQEHNQFLRDKIKKMKTDKEKRDEGEYLS